MDFRIFLSLWEHFVHIRIEIKEFQLTHTDSLMNVSPLHPSVSVLSFPVPPPPLSFSVLSYLPPLFLSLPPSIHPSPLGAHYITKRKTECYLCQQAISPWLWNRLTDKRCVSLSCLSSFFSTLMSFSTSLHERPPFLSLCTPPHHHKLFLNDIFWG